MILDDPPLLMNRIIHWCPLVAILAYSITVTFRRMRLRSVDAHAAAWFAVHTHSLPEHLVRLAFHFLRLSP